MLSTLNIINTHQQVRKANALVEARHNLSEAEQKLILIAASMIARDDATFTRCQIRVADMMRALGIEGKGKYGQLRQLARGLLGRKLYIHKEHSELEATWLASCEYFTAQGMIELEFSQKLAPYLLQLKAQYTGYILANALNLHGKYALRLYELLCQYKSIGFRRMEVAALKHIFEIPPGGAYEDFGQFRRRILEPARQQINAHTDIAFNYQPIKVGRSIVQLDFKFHIKGTLDRACLPKYYAKGGSVQKIRGRKDTEAWEYQGGFRRYQRELAKERMEDLSESERKRLQEDFIENLRRLDEANYKRYKERGQEDLCVKAAYELFQIEKLLSKEERDFANWTKGH